MIFNQKKCTTITLSIIGASLLFLAAPASAEMISYKMSDTGQVIKCEPAGMNCNIGIDTSQNFKFDSSTQSLKFPSVKGIGTILSLPFNSSGKTDTLFCFQYVDKTYQEMNLDFCNESQTKSYLLLHFSGSTSLSKIILSDYTMIKNKPVRTIVEITGTTLVPRNLK